MDTPQVKNMQEHLIILRGAVAEEVTALNLARKERVETQLFLKEEVLRAKEEISKSQHLASLYQKDRLHEEALLNRKALDVENSLQILENTRVQLENYTKETTEKLYKKVAEKEYEVNVMERQLVVLEKQIEQRYNEIDDLDDEAETIELQLEKLDKRLEVETESTLAGIAKGQEILETVKDLENYLLFLQEEAAKQSTNIMLSREAAEEREIAIEKREKNFAIIKSRLKKVFTKLYPNQNIDNLI